MRRQIQLRDLMGKVLAAIEPTQAENTAAWSHGSSIRATLKSAFGLKQLVQVGSRPRNTAIREYSDADYLAVIPRDQARRGDVYIRSDLLMSKLRSCLQTRFGRTDIRRSKQAVTVHFGQTKEAVDVVPAIYATQHDTNWPVFAIPDGFGGWLYASPALHNNYFTNANRSSGWKLASVCRLLKQWKHSRVKPVPILSFHAEMVLAQSGICIGPKSLANCLLEAFDLLISRKCQGFRDPCGVSGIVPSCWSDAQAELILNSMSTSRDHIWRAVMYDEDQHHLEACEQMKMAFNRCI